MLSGNSDEVGGDQRRIRAGRLDKPILTPGDAAGAAGEPPAWRWRRTPSVIPGCGAATADGTEQQCHDRYRQSGSPSPVGHAGFASASASAQPVPPRQIHRVCAPGPMIAENPPTAPNGGSGIARHVRACRGMAGSGTGSHRVRGGVTGHPYHPGSARAVLLPAPLPFQRSHFALRLRCIIAATGIGAASNCYQQTDLSSHARSQSTSAKAGPGRHKDALPTICGYRGLLRDCGGCSRSSGFALAVVAGRSGSAQMVVRLMSLPSSMRWPGTS